MAKPINTVEEILLLEPSVGLEALGALPAETAVREFQRILGGGQLCEEVDVLEIKRAEQYKDVLSSVADALGNIDNLSGLDEKAVLSLRAVLSEGDGDVFYYHPSENRFIAHYHDPDVLVQIGNSLSQAVNAALDANPYFVPADFSPVYWKPRSLYAMRFGGNGCNVSSEQFLAASKALPEPSHVYCGSRRVDLIWAQQYAHLHFVIVEGNGAAPMVEARLYAFQPSPKVDGIISGLTVLAERLELKVSRA